MMANDGKWRVWWQMSAVNHLINAYPSSRRDSYKISPPSWHHLATINCGFVRRFQFTRQKSNATHCCLAFFGVRVCFLPDFRERQNWFVCDRIWCDKFSAMEAIDRSQLIFSCLHGYAGSMAILQYRKFPVNPFPPDDTGVRLMLNVLYLTFLMR